MGIGVAAEAPRAPARTLGIGVALMAGGYFVFAMNDALGKYLVASFGVAQLVAIRSIGSFLILGPMLLRKGENPFRRVERPGLQLARVAITTLDTGLFYAACVWMPLADVMTFYMAGPIYTLLAARLLLGERIGWRRWAAIAAGFVGVLVALNPSVATLTGPALIALVGSVCYSLALVLNRMLAGTSGTALGTFQTIGTLVAAAAFAVFDWRPLTGAGVFWMMLLGVVAITAHLMIIQALKLAPVSVLAPFQYSLLLWGIVMGWAIFGDVPEWNVLVGAAVIVAAGLFIFRREQAVKPEVTAAELTANSP
ncbi:MAG: DMT family transporter [Amaricoccus sp.]|uniref:DMT family transporter n=1 Tax=Amaricoccus sp. TaxID=1872485 RepID=UPI0039E30C9A